MKVSISLSDYLDGHRLMLTDQVPGTKMGRIAYKGLKGLLDVLKLSHHPNFQELIKNIKITKLRVVFTSEEGAAEYEEFERADMGKPLEKDAHFVIFSNIKEVFAQTAEKPVPKNYEMLLDDEGNLTSVLFKNGTLFNRLQTISQQNSCFKKMNSPVQATSLFEIFHMIAEFDVWKDTLTSGWDVYEEFIEALRPFVEKEHAKVEAILKLNNGLKWEHLTMYFKLGAKLIVKDFQRDEVQFGAVCTSVKVVTTGWCEYVQIAYDYIQISDFGFFYKGGSSHIFPYDGVKSLDKLPARLLDEDEATRQMLHDRGEKFVALGTDPNHRFYKGPMFYQVWSGVDRKMIDSRIMVDPISFNRVHANYSTFRFHNRSQTVRIDQVPESEYWKCSPTVPGFCLSTMRWGEILVEDLQEVQFNDQAMDRLVLPQERKDIIKALVSHPPHFKDIVEGKSQGRIFLLHGPPGVGKTSSAEAVAEVLKLPLYKFTSGQLGVKPKELDDRLRDRLTIADRWNAVILLDEADIYLERRKDSDVLRNAMVSIFLNLLEYHQGVLFLTTNRVNCFDEAFQSRINLILHYEDFDPKIRQQVWIKQLESAGLVLQAKEEWFTKSMNGRQIGNCIRLAMSIALSESKPIAMEHLEKAMKYSSS